MSDKKNIDRLYQEKFKDFEPDLPHDLWNKIEAELPQNKKRRVIAWWYYGGIAAGLAILFSIFHHNIDSKDSQNNNQVVIQEKSDKVGAIKNKQTENPKSTTLDNDPDSIKNISVANIEATEDQEKIENPENNGQHATVDSSSTDAAIANNSSNNQENKQNLAQKKQKKQSANKPATGSAANKLNTSIALKTDDDKVFKNKNSEKAALKARQESNLKDKKDATENALASLDKTNEAAENREDSQKIDPLNEDAAAIAQIDSLPNKMAEDAIALQENNKDSLDLNSSGKGKFKGSTLIAPVYSNSFDGSSLNESVADNSKAAGLNLSYGVALDYDINDRLSLRTGLHKIDVTYNTDNVRYMNTAPMGDSPFAGSFDAAAVSDASNNILPRGQMLAPGLVSNSFLGLTGELSQQLGYLEVPLEMRYKLIASRLNLSVSGGMSALFLQENRVQLVGDNRRLELGSDDNFRDFNQSANFGIGLDYGLNDKLGIMIEPMFKYQFNALSNDPSGFRPYTIAVYSGLTYKF